MPDREFKSKEELAALFKEWEQDYTLRQREDAHSPPTHPWPSQVAKANQQARAKAPAKDKGRNNGQTM